MEKPEEQKQQIKETQEIGSWTREMCKPENLDPRIFHSAKELMAALYAEED